MTKTLWWGGGALCAPSPPGCDEPKKPGWIGFNKNVFSLFLKLLMLVQISSLPSSLVLQFGPATWERLVSSRLFRTRDSDWRLKTEITLRLESDPLLDEFHEIFRPISVLQTPYVRRQLTSHYGWVFFLIELCFGSPKSGA